ncbi:MAG: cbb3-type cytochrome c oxidase subunit II [Persicimonas sp.]
MIDLHENARMLFGTAWAVFVALSFAVAIGPAMWSQANNEPVPESRALDAQEQRGLDVYVSEGCVACHTQQVRPIAADEPFGRPSVAGDYARLDRQGVFAGTPALLGSQRTGPDLANVGERQPSSSWHLIHLYNPRAVVEDSVMPAHPWLFREVDNPDDGQTLVEMPAPYGPDDKKLVATERAEALVAYLKSLKQPPLPEGSEAASEDSSAEESKSPGASLYEQKCASCHGSDGSGVPQTFPPLAGDPVVTADKPDDHVRIILEGMQGVSIDGVDYSAAMPGFADSLSDADIAAIVNHERTSWGNDAPTITAEEVAELREAVEAGTDETGGDDE